MSPFAALPGAPGGPGGPGLPMEAQVHMLVPLHRNCFKLVLEEISKHGASYLGVLGGPFLQEVLGEKSLGPQGHLSLLFAQASPLAQVDPFQANLNEKNSISVVSTPCLYLSENLEGPSRQQECVREGGWFHREQTLLAVMICSLSPQFFFITDITANNHGSGFFWDCVPDFKKH